MRINIILDEGLIKKAMHDGHFKTKTETIRAALELLVQFQKQARIKHYRGKLKWEGDLERMRRDA